MAICARDSTGLQQTVEEMRQFKGAAMGVPADVTQGEECRRFHHAAVGTLGPVEVLVNNVGGTRGGRDFDSATNQDWLGTLNLNLMSPWGWSGWCFPP